MIPDRPVFIEAIGASPLDAYLARNGSLLPLTARGELPDRPRLALPLIRPCRATFSRKRAKGSPRSGFAAAPLVDDDAARIIHAVSAVAGRER
jgi:hypothetical protein